VVKTQQNSLGFFVGICLGVSTLLSGFSWLFSAHFRCLVDVFMCSLLVCLTGLYCTCCFSTQIMDWMVFLHYFLQTKTICHFC